MSTASSKGWPVQILTFNQGKVTLNEDCLRDILTQQHVRDLPVAVVSIAGKMRQGKSLLLNNFVRYLQLQGRADWLSDAHGPLEGFRWSGGTTRVTTGVFIWSNLFVVKLFSGKKVVVMLMDTQGSFDTQSNVKKSAVVFALSTMISSMQQIYNIMRQLAGDDLLHLQMFTEYGKLAQQLDQQGNNAFQSIQILIRDWMNKSEAAFGFDGGMKHLNKVLDVECQENQETQDLARDIKSSFRLMECFLMPEPAHCVRSGDFQGNPSAMGAEFTEQLQKFVPHILSPDKLVVKQHAGREIKTVQLFYQFQSLAKIFNSKELPTPQSMLQANAEYIYMVSLDEAMAVYRSLYGMDFRDHTASFTDAHLKSLFEDYRQAAVAEFTKTPKMGGDDMAKKFRQHLEQKIIKQELILKEENDNRIKVERQIKENEEKHRQELQKAMDRIKKETAEALEQEKEETRQLLLVKDISHREHTEQMCKKLQDNFDKMTEAERQRVTEELERNRQEYREQARRDKEDAARREKEIQGQGVENQRRMREESDKNRAMMIAAMPKQNEGGFSREVLGLLEKVLISCLEALGKQ